MPFSKKISLQLAASTTSGIAQSQNGTPNTALTLNGGLVSGGIAVMDVPRRIGVTSVGNDSAITFKVAGTDYFGLSQTETLAGAGTSVAQTVRDFATVTSVIPSSTTSSTVSVGTTGIGSSPPWVVDQFANPASIGVGTILSAVPVNYSIEIAYDNLFPSWDLKPNPPTYYPMMGFEALTTNNNGFVNEPLTMARVTINSGTGSVTANFRQAFTAGRA